MKNNFIPEIESAAPEVQQLLMLQNLQNLVAYLKAQSPYYKRLLNNAAYNNLPLNNLGDIIHFPTTSKDDLQSNNWDFLCVPKSEIAEYTATSGTLGKPVTIALTNKDLKRLAYNEYLSCQLMGAGKESLFQLMLTLDKQFMAGMAYYSGIHQAGASLVRTGPGFPAMQWEVINRLKTDVLVAVPSFLYKMIAFAEHNKIDYTASSVKKVLAIGESLFGEDLQPNNLRKAIMDKWDIELYGTYASTEMQTAFTECSYHKGGHHHPELIYVELLDDNGIPVAEGKVGEVTISTFGIEAMPLLRYRTGDLCKAYYEPCACGRTTMRLGGVMGRKKQMIKYKGTTLYPSALVNVLQSVNEIKDYVIEVSKDELSQDSIVLHIHSEDEQKCDEILQVQLTTQLRVKPVLQFHSKECILQMQFPDKSNRKPLRFIDGR